MLHPVVAVREGGGISDSFRNDAGVYDARRRVRFRARLAFIDLPEELPGKVDLETEVNDMRHLLQRLCQLSRDFIAAVLTISITNSRDHSILSNARRLRKWPSIASLAVAAMLLPSVAFAQLSPWERAASNLEFTFTGPLARSLALVSIVIGGLMFMFGEGGAKRQISGIVFGGGLALFATQFMAWLF